MGEPQQAIIGNTSNTSVILEELPYNSNLSFLLSSVNCAGSSSPVTHTINIGMINWYNYPDIIINDVHAILSIL